MVSNGPQNNCRTLLIRIVMLVVVVVMSFATLAVAGDFASAKISSDNTKTFFAQFVIAGGPIVWFILLPMSVVTLYLAIDHCLSIRRDKLLPAGGWSDIAAIFNKCDPTQIRSKLSVRTDLVSRAVLYAFEQSQQFDCDTKSLHSFAAESLHQRGVQLTRKAEWPNIIGNVAPMVGLFGTVFGMIKAFNLLGISAGQPRPDQLASAISIALITTFWGLLVAIPALTMHGIFRSRIENIVNEAALETETLLRRIAQNRFDNKEQLKCPDKTAEHKSRGKKDRLPIEVLS